MVKLNNSVSTLCMDKTEVWGVGVFFSLSYMVLLLEYGIEVFKLRFFTFMICNFNLTFYKMTDFQLDPFSI